MDEKNYIRYRKIKAFGNKICFILCRIFPIKNNRICVCTFEGKGGFGCNPKYIVEEMHRRNPDYEFIWFVNDMHKKFPLYVKKVPNTLVSRAFWLSTSKIWIDNYRKPYGTCKRKGQYYLNTWHGTIGFKTIGLWRKNAFSTMAYFVSKNDSDMIDDILIDSEWCAAMYPKGMVYNGSFLRTGLPRCDTLFGDRRRFKEKFYYDYGIDKNVKLVMYAPTFREKVLNGKRIIYSERWSIDFQRLLKNLQIRFKGDWRLCVRLHPQLSQNIDKYMEYCKKEVIDVSQADDLYEILPAIDVFITDYSSAAMEAGFAHIPVFIFADDIENYLKERGGLVWDFSTETNLVTLNQEITPGINAALPYSIAKNNEELEYNILNFDQSKYLLMMKQFEKAIQLIFDGNASKRVADKLESYIWNK